jgi:dTDP-4-dehydrorhamnose reductase
MRILLLGASGMLGHRLWLELDGDHEVTAVMRRSPEDAPWGAVFATARVIAGVDLLDDAALDDLFRQVRPEAVVNAAGLIKQRPEGQDPLAAIAVNAALPHRLAARCRAAGARLIHVSTDCVFSGRRGYAAEADLPDPPDTYGRSKLLGEVDGPEALTLRTSIIGRELEGGLGLLEWLLAQRGGRVQGYSRARFSGVTTTELAGTIGRLLAEHPGLTGLRHVAGPPIDKHALLLLAREAFALPVEIEETDGPAIDRTLDDSRFRRETGIPTPQWPAMLDRIAHDPVPYDSFRGIRR